MITIKGSGVLVAALKQEERTAFISRQSPRVQAWASRYERDKASERAEIKAIGKEVVNAEFKFASKSQRKTLRLKPKVLPLATKVVRIRRKAVRRASFDPLVDGLDVYRSRWNNIKRIMWELGRNAWIPAWYKFFGDFRDMRSDLLIARDIIFMKDCVKGMGLRY